MLAQMTLSEIQDTNFFMYDFNVTKFKNKNQPPPQKDPEDIQARYSTLLESFMLLF